MAWNQKTAGITVGTIVSLIGLGLAGMAGSVMLSDYDEDEALFVDLVYVSDGVVNPANEGKMIALQGKLEGDVPIYDPLTGVEIPSLIAYRHIEEYVAEENTDGTTDYQWDRDNAGSSSPINSEYEMPSILMADINIGEYDLDQNLLRQVTPNESYVTVDTGTGMFDAVGDIRFIYTIMSASDTLEYTVFGVQEGNQLVVHPELAMPSAHQGFVTAEQALEKYQDDMHTAGLIFLVVGLLVAAAGGFWIFYTSRLKLTPLAQRQGAYPTGGQGAYPTGGQAWAGPEYSPRNEPWDPRFGAPGTQNQGSGSQGQSYQPPVGQPPVSQPVAYQPPVNQPPANQVRDNQQPSTQKSWQNHEARHQPSQSPDAWGGSSKGQSQRGPFYDS
ncbi:MAG: hypothetical protein GX483_05040 [Actinomycetaceae bacterium]|nr:hypothetical protein [Actinomycetaceae bacterium]